MKGCNRVNNLIKINYGDADHTTVSNRKLSADMIKRPPKNGSLSDH